MGLDQKKKCIMCGHQRYKHYYGKKPHCKAKGCSCEFFEGGEE